MYIPPLRANHKQPHQKRKTVIRSQKQINLTSKEVSVPEKQKDGQSDTPNHDQGREHDLKLVTKYFHYQFHYIAASYTFKTEVRIRSQ
jgi:hypothetical protein